MLCLLLSFDVVCLVREIAVKLGLFDVEIFQLLAMLADEIIELVEVFLSVLVYIIVNCLYPVLEAFLDILQTHYLFVILLHPFFVSFGLCFEVIVLRDQFFEQLGVFVFKLFQTDLDSFNDNAFVDVVFDQCFIRSFSYLFETMQHKLKEVSNESREKLKC